MNLYPDPNIWPLPAYHWGVWGWLYIVIASIMSIIGFVAVFTGFDIPRWLYAVACNWIHRRLPPRWYEPDVRGWRHKFAIHTWGWAWLYQERKAGRA